MDTEQIENVLKSEYRSYCLDVCGLSKHQVMYGHEIIREILTKFFSVYLMHYYIRSPFFNVVFMPFIQDKSADDVNNYRPIALVPILSKIFEACISSN